MWAAWLVAAGLVLSAPAVAAVPVPAPAPACPAPGDEATEAGSLPHLGEALKTGATVNILAVGAGADTKPGPSGAALATPGFFAQVSHALEMAIHGAHVNVTVRGGRGLLAPMQLEMIRAALKQHSYQLVVWQTGTVDAVQGEPPEDFYQALSDGADSIAEADADLVLVEPQYSRFLEANADLSPYLSAVQSVGAPAGRLVFHRYTLMHDWEDAGLIDLEHAASVDRAAVAARLHGCLASALAHVLLTGAARGE
jgi:hypothetical protein